MGNSLIKSAIAPQIRGPVEGKTKPSSQRHFSGTLPTSPPIYLLSLLLTAGLVVVLGSSLFGTVPAIAQSSDGTEDPTVQPADSVDPVAEPSTDPASRPILRPGSRGNAVTELQALLKLLGYYMGPIDGLYQAGTSAAVVKFQRAANLNPDGIVGLDTWNRLLPAAPDISASNPPITPNPPQSPPPTSEPAPESPSTPPAEATPPAQDSTGSTPSPSTEPDEQPNPSVDLPVLRIGMRGPAVERLQERLRSLDAYQGAIDGVFGPVTQSAVKAAQTSNQLTPDGVVGPATWRVLLR